MVPHGGYVTCTAYNQEHGALLQVAKAVRLPEDKGRFNVFVDNTPLLDDVGAPGGASDPYIVALGQHTIREEAVPPTSLNDYDTSIECVDLNDGDRVVAHNTGQTSITVNLTSVAEHILCTITNENNRFGDLTVIKHLIPASDSGRFNLHVTGPVSDQETGAGTSLAEFSISTTCVDKAHGDRRSRTTRTGQPSQSISAARPTTSCARSRISARRAHWAPTNSRTPRGRTWGSSSGCPRGCTSTRRYRSRSSSTTMDTDRGWGPIARGATRRCAARQGGGPRHDPGRRYRRMAAGGSQTRRVADGPRHAARLAPRGGGEQGGRHRSAR